MRIMSLDLGKRTGVASGVVGEGMPRVEAVVLRKRDQGIEVQAKNLACFLRDRWTMDRPDIVIVESPMNPSASASADATLSQLYCHGALHAIAGVYGMRVETVAPSTARVHFCGQASAAPRRKGGRTREQKIQDRKDTNRMVVRRAILLGYLPKDSDDWDKASAAALFDYGASKFARATPKEIVLFGETAK